LNANIRLFNNGKNHQPIKKVRVFEVGNKFSLGETGSKKKKYVEAAKGTNLFFAIYIDENNKRSYDTIPLNLVIERLKQNLSPVPETNEKGHNLLFYLSPNDLVYIPDETDSMDQNVQNFELKPQRIYKMVSF
jgi:CRISPR-associated endonuclease Csn1